MDFEKFRYPDNGYFDFTAGLPLSNFEINGYIKQGLEHLESEIRAGVKRPSFSISCGRVHVTGFAYPSDIDKYTVSVQVANQYAEKTIIDIAIEK